jgi:signal transduction histidine kinase
MSGVVAMALGVVFVGRPIRLLVEKARRVGAGDFDGELALRQRDELGELAAEMNAMSRRLADARDHVTAETRARTAALEQLRHAERLTTVGKLASGVAHELGTPLNVITVRSGMIEEGEIGGVDARAGARVIREQAERITRIVRQLLDFARRRTPDRSAQDIAAIVDRTVALVEPLARRAAVEVTVHCDERPLQANIDPVQIQQVLTNLAMNGIQAMPAGGRLHIDLRRTRAESPPDVGAGVLPCLAVSVEDEGNGMDAATLAQVFDPFFTTKAVGEGTGLGLSVAYGIVREHGGWIAALSTRGEGSRFMVFIPEHAS